MEGYTYMTNNLGKVSMFEIKKSFSVINDLLEMALKTMRKNNHEMCLDFLENDIKLKEAIDYNTKDLSHFSEEELNIAYDIYNIIIKSLGADNKGFKHNYLEYSKNITDMIYDFTGETSYDYKEVFYITVVIRELSSSENSHVDLFYRFFMKLSMLKFEIY